MTATRSFSTKPKAVPQTQRLNERQVKNSAGGYVYELEKWQRFHRFLILGSDVGSYYVGAKKTTAQAVDLINACLRENPRKTVDMIVRVSDEGRAPSNDPALFALALVASSDVDWARRWALANLTKVARTSTHLFHFAQYINNMRSWGRGVRSAFKRWYDERVPVIRLARDMVAYQGRDGWTHADVLRSAHIRPSDPDQNILFKWAVDGYQEEWDYAEERSVVMQYLSAYEELKQAGTVQDVIRLISQWNFTRGTIPTQWLNNRDVWEVLLPRMKYTELVRNLGKLSSMNMFPYHTRDVVDKLTSQKDIDESRVHPVQILLANRVYAMGQGLKGDNNWGVNHWICEALDEAFYMAFKSVKPSGKSLLWAVDASGSMDHPILTGDENHTARLTTLSCREAALAFAMVSLNADPGNTEIIAFTDGNHVHHIDIDPSARMPDVLTKFNRVVQPNNTDCNLPMRYALSRGMRFDGIVIGTDSQTFSGRTHVDQGIAEYRRKVGRVLFGAIAFAQNEFTIADPNDVNNFNLAGMDTNTPSLIAEHMRGEQ